MQVFRAAVIFLAISILSLNTFAQTGDDTIKVDASIVVVNASITDASGTAVTGLGEKLFKIFEDGVEQKIESFGSEESPFAAVILIDTSGSMEERVSLARSAAIAFLQGMRGDDYASIYNFDSQVTLVQEFSNSRDIRDQAYGLKSGGNTVLYDAIYKAAEVLSKRVEKRRAIIVLSDGADTMSAKNSDKALSAALAANSTIYSVDMSRPDALANEKFQNQGVLRNFAEKTGGKFIAAPGGYAMRDAFKGIVAELGVQYTLAYAPANAKPDGKWRSIEVRVARPNLKVRARKGYKAPKK